MAFEDVAVRRFFTWKVFPVVLICGTVWYYKRRGVTMKSIKYRLTAYFIAKVMAHFNRRKDVLKIKDELFAGLADQKKTNKSKQLQILEIGAGGGTNFEFYPVGSSILCLDPNPCFESYLSESAENSGVELKGFIKSFAEKMDSIEDNSIDVVVCTMVLCSVRDLGKALGEVKRVLKPGSKFYYLEHVAANRGTCLNRTQRMLNPLWYALTGDCQITRETGRVIQDAEFSKTSMEHFNLKTKFFIIKPFLMGTATK